MVLSKVKVVMVGCGTGQSNLAGSLKEYFEVLTAIVGVTDNGGHSGQLRQQCRIPQVGDGRQVLTALARNTALAALFQRRFDSDGSELHGTNLGNFILAALCQGSDIACAFQTVASILECRGLVLPATLADTQVGAILADSREVVGEWQIMERCPPTPISKLFLQPAVAAYPAAVAAIADADWVIIGPGSLLTGIIPVFLAKGMSQVLQQTKARIIYISNLMTQPGQTDNFTLGDHICALQHYVGRLPDFVVANQAPIPPGILGYYQQIGSRPIVDDEEADGLSYQMVRRDLVPAGDGPPVQERVGEFKKWTHLLVHDAEKLAATVAELIGVSSGRQKR